MLIIDRRVGFLNVNNSLALSACITNMQCHFATGEVRVNPWICERLEAHFFIAWVEIKIRSV